MKSRFALALLCCAAMAALLGAQDKPPRAPKDEDKGGRAKPPAEKVDKKEAPPRTEGEDAERLKKIIERLHKNMDSSEERLNKKDPGEDTRKIQGDIVSGLDELIKQQGKGGGGGGGGGGASSSGGGKGGASGKSTSRKGGGGSKQKSANGQKKSNPEGLGKSLDKDKQSAQGTLNKGEPRKEGKNGDGMGGNPDAKDKKELNTIGDLFKDVWGHLPQNKRQEMDAYAKERFLRKYEEILRQYYKTISEQGRRSDGE